MNQIKDNNKSKFRILAIESSCDETSASIVEAIIKDQKSKIKNIDVEIISNIISSQVKLHAKYGGVYPELASREHIKNILPVIEEALRESNSRFTSNKVIRRSNKVISNRVLEQNTLILNTSDEQSEERLLLNADIDAIAVTTGPGLIGSLLVGVNTAKTLAYTLKKPIYAINHLEGHVYSCFARENSKFKFEIINQAQNSNFKTLDHLNLIKNYKLKIKNSMPQFPLVALVVSGGHTSLVYMKNHFDYQVIGETLDDAAGEAFDKVAVLLGLGYPGGPAIATEAAKVTKGYEKLITVTKSYQIKATNRNHFTFPRPMLDSPNFDFSFSGLKTAVLYMVNKLKTKSENLKTTTPASSAKLGGQATQNSKSKDILRDDVVAQICYEFQEAVVETLVTKTLRAAAEYGVKSILLCGGVSANSRLREDFTKKLKSQEAKKLDFFVPEKSLSSDNAAMIGIAAAYRVALGKKPTPWYDVNADSNLKLF